VEDDMAVDTMLWVLIAAGAGLIWCGCVMTADTKKPANPRGGRFGH
jgi:hypothetical protein